MPRGDNPNSRANLIPQSKRTKKEQREIAKKGGKASGEARAFYKSLNEDLKERCTPERLAKINEKVLAMAERGNLKAYELVRDGLGEKPNDKVELSGTVTNPMAGLTEDELRKLAGDVNDS